MRALLLRMSSWMVALQRLIWENGRMINDVDMEFQKGVTVLSKFYKLYVTIQQHHHNNKSNLQFHSLLFFLFSLFHFITSFLRSFLCLHMIIFLDMKVNGLQTKNMVMALRHFATARRKKENTKIMC